MGEGEKVLMLHPSANRDEDVFDRPDEILRRLPDLRFADSGPVEEPHALVRSCARMKIGFTKESR